MNLFNQTLERCTLQIAEGAGFNPDIFESNVVNLALLVGGIFYLWSNALSTSLNERQQKIVGAIQESEERLQQAVAKLADSEKQLADAQLVIETIRKDAEATAQQVKSALLNDGKIEIERLTLGAKLQIGTIEARIRKQISDYVATLALQRVTSQLEGKLNSNLQNQIIDRNISKLGD